MTVLIESWPKRTLLLSGHVFRVIDLGENRFGEAGRQSPGSDGLRHRGRPRARRGGPGRQPQPRRLPPAQCQTKDQEPLHPPDRLPGPRSRRGRSAKNRQGMAMFAPPWKKKKKPKSQKKKKKKEKKKQNLKTMAHFIEEISLSGDESDDSFVFQTLPIPSDDERTSKRQNQQITHPQLFFFFFFFLNIIF